MTKMVDDVEDFHKAFGVKKGLTYDILKLRIELMREEYKETLDVMYEALDEIRDKEEVFEDTLAEILDGLVDQTVINIGTADVLGFDFGGGWDEVMKSNMSKLNEDGSVSRRSDGKVLKGKNYKRPNLNKFV